ncbi:MAG: hypothetical protein NT056_11125 [Proteobacteria bacterium]|nr:hypothetical protein [Pseudomonadota bacterium]
MTPSPLRARFQPVGLTGRRVGSYEPEAPPSPSACPAKGGEGGLPELTAQVGQGGKG